MVLWTLRNSNNSMPLILLCGAAIPSQSPYSACPPESLYWSNLDQAVDFATLGITQSGVAEVFGWGFGSIVFFWSIGYFVALAKVAIGRL